MRRSSAWPQGHSGLRCSPICVLRAVPAAGGVINCADQRQPAHLLVCPHVVIVQINAHSKLAVYFLKFNIVFVILKYLL